MWQISTKTDPRKSTRHLLQESVISRTPVWRILHDGVKLFPYKIQILRRQTDQKKSRRRNILERYPSKDRKWPWLVGFEWFERCRPLWPLYDICHTSCLPKVGHQTLNFPSIRYIVPAKISPAILLCQKNWFCGKVCLDHFYPLLRSKLSSWVYTGIKRIPQACWLYILAHIFYILMYTLIFFLGYAFCLYVKSWRCYKY